jgi:isopenicillin N synthase-like dioxygenase
LTSKEHFDIGATTDLAFPNKWLTADELPGFREFMESLFETMEHVNRSILQALELGFGLPPNTFTDKCSHMGNASEFRVTHYPGISVEEMKNGHTSRIWPHTDLGVITLLLQDSVGGLEFQDRKHPSNFLPVESNNPAEMIVSVSETLQRWTNDALPAAVHRVTLPAALKGQQDGILRARYSAAYFCKADRETSVGPIKQFVGPQENGAKYADMSAIEYHKQRLATAY